MKNIIHYAGEATNPLSTGGFNTVDSLILSQMAYWRYEGIVPGFTDSALQGSIGELVTLKEIAAAPEVGRLFSGVRDEKSNRELFAAVVDSPRFCNTKIGFYVSKTDVEEEKQFSAVTFLLEDDTAYIAYRGTDSTFIGWKEDFNMAFTSPVPAQQEGVAYMHAVAHIVPCTLRAGGHSKGGNVAVYSAIYCGKAVQDRLVKVYSHDGPGFRDDVFRSEGYERVKTRIEKNLPQSAVIGILLQNQELYSVVKSSRMWLMQHDPFSWMIQGQDFQYISSITKTARFMNGTVNQWLSTLDDAQREKFINTLFHVLQATEATTFADLLEDWPKRAVAMLRSMKDIDAQTREFLVHTIRSLVVLVAKNFREELKPENP